MDIDYNILLSENLIQYFICTRPYKKFIVGTQCVQMVM